MPTPRRSISRLGGVLLASAVLLAGCGGGVPLIGGSASTGPSASAKATAAIDTAAGIRLAKAAVKALNKDPFVTHVEQISTATQDANGTTFQMIATLSADFSGKDMSVEMEATTFGDKIALRFRTVGKNAYVFQSGRWIKGKRASVNSQLADIVDAVRTIKDPNDLQYLGEDRVGKKDLHHFRANRELSYDASVAGGVWVDGRYDSYEIWVEADGTPVRVESTFNASSAEVGTVTGTSVMDFTKFGGPIKIKVPKIKK